MNGPARQPLSKRGSCPGQESQDISHPPPRRTLHHETGARMKARPKGRRYMQERKGAFLKETPRMTALAVGSGPMNNANNALRRKSKEPRTFKQKIDCNYSSLIAPSELASLLGGSNDSALHQHSKSRWVNGIPWKCCGTASDSR